MKVNYSEMFPHEFKVAMDRNPIAFLPLGSLEYHGYHNVLGLDSLKALRICQLAAEKIGGVVFPPLYLGVDTWPDIDIQKYPNKKYDCYHIDKEIYQRILENYFYRMSKIGFKKIFVLAGHYPNAEIAKLACNKFKGQNIEFIIVKEPDLLEGEPGDHAGKFETSLMMILYPDSVDLGLMENKDDKLMAVVGEDPANSSAEYGKILLDKIIFKINNLLARTGELE